MAPSTRPVRRAPLATRLRAYLNPLDLLLWLSEELNTNDFDNTLGRWAAPIGLIINIIFMIARANAKAADEGLDVFADAYEGQGSEWLAYFATFIAHCLTTVSLSNAFYTFWRRRHYRLFESDINAVPRTPSARRVRVDSSPMSSSPLRCLTDILATSTAESRAHPDGARDVWELRVWDPTPICLELFCYFSPGHVFVYWLFLPLDTLDPRPSITLVKTIALNILLTSQLLLLQTSFSRQAKDAALVQKEVHIEYNTKYVHPATHHPVRDVATQSLSPATPKGTHEVLVSTPHTYVNRGFNPRPNPAYASHYDPDAARSPTANPQEQSRSVTTPLLRTPANVNADFSSPLKSTPAPARQPDLRPNGQVAGGYLGVHSHAQSPLRKHIHQNKPLSLGGEGLRSRDPVKRQSSPLKKARTPGGGY